MSSTAKKVYFNKAQQYVMFLAVRDLTVIASRRFGKSEGIIMPTLLRNLQAMPRSSGAIVAATFKQALTRTLPATFHAFNRLGYQENIHYYVGRKAPANAYFKEPHIKPRDWDNFIHWYNGSVNPIISQDVSYSSNSLTLDYYIVDEAKTINFDKLQNETIPAVSGLVYYRDCPWHLGKTIVSDMPTSKQGLWILKDEEKMDVELIKLIEHLVIELYELKSRDSGSYFFKNKLNQLREELSFYRSKASLFVVYNILDNLEVIGEQYVTNMIRDLNPFVLLTALLSERLKQSQGGFYGALKDKLHYYTAFNNDYFYKYRKLDGSIDYSAAAKATFDCSQDTDIDKTKPLRIAFDTNININWLVVGQPNYDKSELKTIKSFFVKNNKMLPEVCNEFADYYASLPSKDVIFYYDQTFLQGKSGNSTETFSETIIRVLSTRGWFVQACYIGSAMKHPDKHKEIDQALKSTKGLFPRFNQPNNEDLLIGMERTMTRVNVNGWGKDKGGEKLPDDPDNPVEHRTDGGDAWDTLYIGCVNYPDILSSNYSTEIDM